MRNLVAGWLFVTMAAASGCARGDRCDPRVHRISTTTTTPYTFYNDGNLGSIVTRRENVFGPDAGTYDVRDVDGLRGAVEVVLLKLPELAREQGATYVDLGGGALRIIGAPRAHAFVREVLAMLRASPGPRPHVGGSDLVATSEVPSRLLRVLSEHGFTPPLAVETHAGGAWVSERVSFGAPQSVERVLVLSSPTTKPHVHIERWSRGPSEWAQQGPLLVGTRLEDEAREIEEVLQR